MNKDYVEIEINDECLHKNGKCRTLIIYDITDNKRRLKMVKFLEGFGFRVQKSAFEAVINLSAINRLKDGIGLIIGKEDNVRIYVLKGVSEVFSWGEERDFYDEDCIII